MERRASARRVAAGVGVAALLLTSAACSTHRPEAAQTPEAARAPVTLTVPPPVTGECGPDRLVRCVPGVADFNDELFDDVLVNPSGTTFGFWPQTTTAPDSQPAACARIPKLGAATGPELDVSYAAATHADRMPRSHRFAGHDAAWVEVRLMAADGHDDLLGAMTDWIDHCPIYRVAPTGVDDGIQTWLLGESADALAGYEAGDIAGQWRRVTQMAAAILPSGVIVQAWYRTDDPSAASRRDTLAQLINAVGRHRPRSELPRRLDDWSPNQLSTLLPPLAKAVTVSTENGQDAAPPWTQCGHTDDTVASPEYQSAERREDAPYQFGEPTVTITRAHPGTDYLGDLRREIASCAAHSRDKPGPECADRDDRRYLTSDTAAADGENTVRFTHRWMRVVNVQAYDRCSEGIEMYRVTQVRGFLVITSARSGGPKAAPGPSPQLPLHTLDELHAATVHQIKTA